MYDDDDDYEDDFYGDIPEEAFYYEDSARKYGINLGYREAADGIDSISNLDNIKYPKDADEDIIEIFKDAYFEGVEKYNNEFDDEEDEWN